MATSTAPFHIRLASERQGDAAFVLRAHDSALPYLASIGSSQWGTESFSARPSAVAAIEKLVRDSERSKQREEQTVGDNNVEEIPFIRTFVAETLSDATPCAAASIEDVFPSYVKASPSDANFFYLDRLVSDRANQSAKGAGAALLQHCKDECRAYGKTTLFTDCFAGPPLGLRGYYERNGFHLVKTFSVPSKHVDGSDWQGALLRCDL